MVGYIFNENTPSNCHTYKKGYKMEPLVIQIGRQRDGCTYQLPPSSRVQLKKSSRTHALSQVFLVDS